MQKISKYTLASILTTLPKWPAAQSTGFCPHCANMEGEGSEKVNNLPQGHHLVVTKSELELRTPWLQSLCSLHCPYSLGLCHSAVTQQSPGPQAAPLSLSHATLAPPPGHLPHWHVKPLREKTGPFHPCAWCLGSSQSGPPSRACNLYSQKSHVLGSICCPLLHNLTHFITDLMICKWSLMGQWSMCVSRGDNTHSVCPPPSLCRGFKKPL